MKKMYIKPETEEMALLSEGVILSTSDPFTPPPMMPNLAPAHKVSTSGGVGVGLPDM